MDDLKELFKEKHRGTPTAWVTFKDTFQVEVEFTERRELRKIIKRASKKGWVNHQPTEDIDENRMAEEMSAKIRNWRGLTPEVLAQILPIDTSDLQGEIPCTQANKELLLTEAYDFDLFLQRVCTELANFQEAKREEDLKNS